MTKTKKELRECGYCKRVQRNRGGNTAYRCKRHQKRVTFSKIRMYDQEELDQALKQQREEILEGLEGEEVTSVDVSRLESKILDGEVKWRKFKESKVAKYGWNEATKNLNAKIKEIRGG